MLPGVTCRLQEAVDLLTCGREVMFASDHLEGVSLEVEGLQDFQLASLRVDGEGFRIIRSLMLGRQVNERNRLYLIMMGGAT